MGEAFVKKKKKKKYFTLLFLFGILIICITSATYAYFDLSAMDENTITGTVGGANLILTVTKELPTITPTHMVPQLETTLDDAVSNSYLCIDDNDNVVCQVYKATITNTGAISLLVDGNISFSGIDTLPNLRWRRMDSLTTYGDYASYPATTTVQYFENSKLLDPGDSYTYYFVIWVNEISAQQEDEGTFRATINFNSVSGGNSTSVEVSGAAKYVQDLYFTEGDTITTVNIGDDASNPQVSLNSTRGILLDNNGEYRYYGANPNNYVTFNGELWRIIGVSTVKYSEDDLIGSRRIKLIRNESIGIYSFDSDTTDNSEYGFNNWVRADIKTTLNTLYSNKLSGICYIGSNNESKSCDFSSLGLSDAAKFLMDDALWYLGAISYAGDLYADDLYTYERGSLMYDCSDDSCGGPRSATWVGKVGLMYPSDYMYATDLSVCTGVRNNDDDHSLDYSSTECSGNDWLYHSTLYQYTLSPSLDTDRYLNIISGFVGFASPSVPLAIRPVVYLKSSVEITGGAGTSENPYTLSGA